MTESALTNGRLQSRKLKQTLTLKYLKKTFIKLDLL